ncbi:uncharacterized protein L969DRAFT_91710 [Mixia osmundae IAM 14324]|uniref:Nascent polypeptide-associated complex subunit beta n=1 Tax=Mixia osmundae (strain CBS 9802 / IAM 14324 / JCM 22182 / KY 12970) TaxID=764103 RepID=G7E0A2_MIXOS|nr:uncharacterized protein L969DRAFT_91710 [Mixia osmundae IAM 14324]KEI42252.1 hypothetical protein L969DRAFT_91710 [Mixia osmundae IAM 14324]GAA96262.1 hypothetical protein E5Q_02926 [Mixia osmundae IAM 14324]
MDTAKLARMQAAARQGSKGTPRRKQPVKAKTTSGDDKKLQAALNKLPVQTLAGIEEVNMFKDDDSGTVLHFAQPKVHASAPSNTYAIYGHGQEKDLTDLLPGILSQMGPEALSNLNSLARSYQGIQSGLGAASEDDVPDLEPAGVDSGSRLEEVN